MKAIAGAILIATAALTACSDSPTQPTALAPSVSYACSTSNNSNNPPQTAGTCSTNNNNNNNNNNNTSNNPPVTASN